MLLFHYNQHPSMTGPCRQTCYTLLSSTWGQFQITTNWPGPVWRSEDWGLRKVYFFVINIEINLKYIHQQLIRHYVCYNANFGALNHHVSQEKIMRILDFTHGGDLPPSCVHAAPYSCVPFFTSHNNTEVAAKETAPITGRWLFCYFSLYLFIVDVSGD